MLHREKTEGNQSIHSSSSSGSISGGIERMEQTAKPIGTNMAQKQAKRTFRVSTALFAVLFRQKTSLCDATIIPRTNYAKEKRYSNLT
ncbi:unnamed protein product [Ectocarpus sp. 6 AP-2014]